MRKIVLLIIILFLTLFLVSEVRNPDRPLKAEWDLKAEKVWDIGEAEGEPFAQPVIAVSGDGTCCIYDYKNLKNYIFDSAGNFKKAFGKSGVGPGEVVEEWLKRNMPNFPYKQLMKKVPNKLNHLVLSHFEWV
jgi:hypothetical protein